jgi:hypothetical protein
MSVHYERDRAKYIVRWREDGKQRARRFTTEADAEAFDAVVNPSTHGASQRGRRAAALDQVARLEAERAERASRDGPPRASPLASIAIADHAA